MNKHKEIRDLAYELFEKSGRVHGREIEHWLEAEHIIRAREMDMHATDIEAAALKKHIPRSDVRRHEPIKPADQKRPNNRKGLSYLAIVTGRYRQPVPFLR